MTFDQIIGQEQTKKELNMRLEAFSAGQPMPSLLFIAPRGKGKTMMATATGLEMKARSGGTRRYFELNAASIKGIKQFWNSVIVPIVNDRDVTLHIDEAHMLPSDVTNCLLTLINPNVNHINSYSYDDMTVTANLRRQSFMFSTTEAHRLFIALVNRCRRIDLQDYSRADMVGILKKHVPDVVFEAGVLEDIASTLRETPRQAVMMAEDIKTYLAPYGANHFSCADWVSLRNSLGVLPLGLTRLELRVLQVLRERRDSTLTRVAASLQMTTASVRGDLELHLLKCGLIQIDDNGRNLTKAGYNYLETL